jgi:hypothetical protein
MNWKRNITAAALAGLVSAGCVDLEVQNPGAPDRDRALRTANDVEQLIAGSYRNFYNVTSSSGDIGPVLMTVSFEHAGSAANFGMVEFSSWPRVAVHNMPAHVYYGQFMNPWYRYYRAVSAVNTGLQILDEGAVTLPDAQLSRARAYGYFVLGISHGSAALLHDQAYVFAPEMSLDEVNLAPYPEVMTAALGFLDKAIAEAQGKSWTIPEQWMARETSAANLVRLATSYKARFRANVARTPAERAAVNWSQVIADVDAGITQSFTWNQRTGSGWTEGTLLNMTRLGGWGNLPYQMYGMADQSGQYQKWLAKDPWQRHPFLSEDQTSDAFLIMTPDKRFPQGATIAEQQANPGTHVKMEPNYGGNWIRPDRGSFRWSFYRYSYMDEWRTPATNRHDFEEMPLTEMRMLKAEGLIRTGNNAAAADLINVTRVAAGLNPTDASGTNTDCVPKLPNGTCGNLMEMMKWELRMQTTYRGPMGSAWYFNGRGWGDLAQGVFLQVPIPGREAELLGLQPYTFGGASGESAAPVGTYGF